MIIARLILALLFLLGTSIHLNAQLTIQPPQSGFKSVMPWNEGYLGVVAPMAKVNFPKKRFFQYYDFNGELVWNVELDPYNKYSHKVLSPDSKYVYYVCVSSQKHMMPRSNKIILNVFQIDRNGNTIEKDFEFDDDFEDVKKDGTKLSSCYLAKYKDGFVFVTTGNFERYHVLKINKSLEVEKMSVSFEWNEKLWRKNLLSKPKFELFNEKLYLINATIDEGRLNQTIKTVDLETMTKVGDSKNNLMLENNDLHFWLEGYGVFDDNSEHVLSEYWHFPDGSDNAKYHLGSKLYYQANEEGLFFWGYYLNSTDTKRIKNFDEEGFLRMELNPNSNDVIERKDYFTFSKSTNPRRWATFKGIQMLDNGDVWYASKRYNEPISIRIENGSEETVQTGDIAMGELFWNYLKGEGLGGIYDMSRVYSWEGNYVGIKYGRRKNYGQGFENATIYRMER